VLGILQRWAGAWKVAETAGTQFNYATILFVTHRAKDGRHASNVTPIGRPYTAAAQAT
jgi:hypothetical protein